MLGALGIQTPALGLFSTRHKSKRTQVFPPVVVRDILRHACPSSDRAGTGNLNLDFAATVRYSLVSRSWREEAKKLLFHQIDFTSMRRFIRMRTFIRTSPATATHVRVLSLAIGSNYHTHVQGSELPDVMNMFPYLYELRLHSDDPPVFTPATIQQLEATPPIISLRITPTEADQCPDFLLQLLQIPWPLLHLSISRPFAGPVHWMATEKVQALKNPSWNLTEYRTDAFLGWEVLFEWIILNSLETLTVLHMPPDSKNTPLSLVSPRLLSLNIIWDANAMAPFEGMARYPPFPMLQELILTDAILVPGPTIYQSIPPSVTCLGITLDTKIQTMLKICPTIPMRIDIVTVYYEGKIVAGTEAMVKRYKGIDGRFAMKRRRAHTPCMVHFHGTPRDDAMANKKAMDHAISGRRQMDPVPLPPKSAPWLLTLIYSALSLNQAKSP